MRSAGRTEECVKEVVAYRCLKQRMKQSLSDVIGVPKRASREKRLSLLGYKLITRRTKAEDCMELGAELRNKRMKVRKKVRRGEQK